MSAIYGAIDLNRNAIDKDLPARFDAGYTKCKIDKNNSLLKDNVYMHCGVQYFYPRAKAEKLPFYDEESNIYITADCVIDNRKELLPELGLEATAPDGDIIFAAYKKWGKECCKHLQGLFSFVIYDAGKNEIFAAVDQFAQRCLFYHVRDGVFYFSTLFFPIPEATGLKFEENERWLVDTVSLRSPVMMTEPKETAIVGILKVVSGTQITVNIEDNHELQVREIRYYDPYNTIPTDWSITREQSLEMVRKELTEAVERIVEEQDKVAAQLSSGLDSSSVACTAARILEKKGKKLYSFTSVPLKEANLEKDGYLVYDETEGVKKICNAYSNIEPTFVECNGRDYLFEAEDIIDIWEMPCKSQQNAVWGDEIDLLAVEKECTILLTGATGNCTLSAGNCWDVALYYLKHLNIIKAYHMFDSVKKVGASRKRMVKALIRTWLDYYLWYFKPGEQDYYKRNATRKDVGEKFNLLERFQKNNMHFYPFHGMNRMRKDMYMVLANAQMGEIETKESLRYGVLQRDPMRTVPVINMCFSFPITCFASDDYDRRLIRVGMRGIVPDEIISDMAHRGRQSGDSRYRMAKDWPNKVEDIRKKLYGSNAMRYLDIDKVDLLLGRIGDDLDKAENDDLLLIMDLYSFGIYLEILNETMLQK